MCQQPVPCGQIDDTTAAKPAADPPRHLPGFVQLFPRQAPRVTHGARQPVEQPVARKAIEIVAGEPSLRRDRERHGS